MGGSLAGGYGTLRFPSEEALASWRHATVDAQRWSDWQALGLPTPREGSVAERLLDASKEIRGVFSVQIEGVRVTFTYEEDGADFEAHAADVASLLRVADRHGAAGELFFLETGDAVPDGFVYRLVVGGGTSRVERLGPADARAAYGAGYRAFQQRTRALYAQLHPALAELDRWIAEGAALDPGVAALHAQVIEALADCPDRALAKLAKDYRGRVLDGRGQLERFLVKDTRRALADARSNDHRAAALFALSHHAPERALPIAIEVLEHARESAFAQPMREVAMAIAASARGEHAERLWPHFAAPFARDWPPLFAAAARGMARLELDLTERLRVLLADLTAYASARPQPWDAETGPGELLAALIEERRLPLWLELVAYVEEARADRERYRIVERIVRAGDRAAEARLLGSHDGVLAAVAERAIARLRPPPA